MPGPVAIAGHVRTRAGRAHRVDVHVRGVADPRPDARLRELAEPSASAVGRRILQAAAAEGLIDDTVMSLRDVALRLDRRTDRTFEDDGEDGDRWQVPVKQILHAAIRVGAAVLAPARSLVATLAEVVRGVALLEHVDDETVSYLRHAGLLGP